MRGHDDARDDVVRGRGEAVGGLARADDPAKTDRLRKAVLAEIGNRLADGKQDHEVPSEKEVANNAAEVQGLLTQDNVFAVLPIANIGKRMRKVATRTQVQGRDVVFGFPSHFGLGFMLPQGREGTDFGPNPRAFGHPGAGGSVGFADPENRVGFGYVMNRMGPHILLDPRATALIDATYEALGRTRA